MSHTCGMGKKLTVLELHGQAKLTKNHSTSVHNGFEATTSMMKIACVYNWAKIL
jgi:hypothetical protein